MAILYPYLLCLLISLFSITSVRAQDQRPYLQHIELKDRVLRQNVADFVRHSGSRWLTISVQFDSTDQGYIYHLSDVGYYEVVRNYRGQPWGEWHHIMLLVYCAANLEDGFHLANTTSLMPLQQYARISLPRAMIRQPGTHNVRLNVRVDWGTEYTFKVVKGQEVYFYDNRGNDNRVPLDLPPVPESKP